MGGPAAWIERMPRAAHRFHEVAEPADGGPGLGAAGTFDRCYREHAARILRVCMRYSGGDRHIAEEITHDVFVKLIESLPHLNEREDLGGWLYRVAANTAISRLRRERSLLARAVEWLEGAVPPAQPSELYECQEDAQRALEALRRLPPMERVAICMKVLDGRNQREIAAALSISEGYVSKLVARASASLSRLGWEVHDG